MGKRSKPENGNEQRQLVYVIDDDLGVRRSLSFLLGTSGFTTWPFACAFDFLDNLPSLTPAPILLDIKMSEIDGIDLMIELFKRALNWPIIVITAHADIPTAVQAVKLGAIEILEKPLDFDLLGAALCTAMEKLGRVTAASEIHGNARCLFETLSPREIEVLILLMDGLPNKVAAHRLSLSVRTIEMHRANGLHKLKVKSVAEVAHLARDAGMTLKGRQIPLIA